MAEEIAPLLETEKRTMLAIAKHLIEPGQRCEGHSLTSVRRDLRAAFKHPRDTTENRQIWVEQIDDGHQTQYLKIGAKHE